MELRKQFQNYSFRIGFYVFLSFIILFYYIIKDKDYIEVVWIRINLRDQQAGIREQMREHDLLRKTGTTNFSLLKTKMVS